MTATAHAGVTHQRIAVDVCVLCGGRGLFVNHRSGAASISQCQHCGLVMRNPQPSDDELRAIYRDGYFFGHDDPDLQASTSALKSATAGAYLDLIERYRGSRARHGRPTLLDVGCGHGDLLALARARGYDIRGIDVSEDAVRVVCARLGDGVATNGELADASIPPGTFDVCVLSDVIEHARDPVMLLRGVRRILKADGTLFISTPSVQHWSARLMRQYWMEFKDEHLFYFDPQTMRLLLAAAGFGNPSIGNTRKILNLDYLCAHFRRFRVPLLTPLIGAVQHVTPRSWRQHAISISTGAMTVAATPSAVDP